MVTFEQWQAGSQIPGVPPWDGTGIPFPLGSDGWPVIPGFDDLIITAPIDGAEVDPLVDIVGTGAEPNANVDLHVSSSPGAPVETVTADATGAFIFTGSTPLDVSPETLWVTSGDEESAHITITVTGVLTEDPNMGWTVAELKQFAADHDPPITVPQSGTKAEILAAILAYIEAHPEEN